jgi:hypothetical protein
MLDEVKDFLKDKTDVSSLLGIQQSLELIQTNSDWRAMDLDSTCQFLANTNLSAHPFSPARGRPAEPNSLSMR